MEFRRIQRLPPYVFNVIGDLKQAARRAGEDVVDLSMGNPDGPTPPHVVQNLSSAATALPHFEHVTLSPAPSSIRNIIGEVR